MTRLPYLISVTHTSPSPALRHRRGVSDRNGRNRLIPLLVATATATDGLGTVAHPGGIGGVAAATADSARLFLARSEPAAGRVACCSSKILMPRASPELPG